MQAKQWTRFFMIPVLWCSFNTWAADVLQVRQLNLGVQQHLDFPDGIKKVAVADDQIVHVTMDRVPGQGNTAKLLLTPLKVGATSLKVWNGKSAEPHAFLLEVQPSVHVRDNRQYQHLADMVRKETAIKEAKGREIASLHAGQLQHKSNVVQVDVKIVELNKNKLKQAGLNIFSTAANSRGFSFGVLSAGGGGGTEASVFSGLWSADGFWQSQYPSKSGNARGQWHGARAGTAFIARYFWAECKFSCGWRSSYPCLSGRWRCEY